MKTKHSLGRSEPPCDTVMDPGAVAVPGARPRCVWSAAARRSGLRWRGTSSAQPAESPAVRCRRVSCSRRRQPVCCARRGRRPVRPEDQPARHLFEDAQYLTRVETFPGLSPLPTKRNRRPSAIPLCSSADRRPNDMPNDTPRKAGRGLECEYDRFRHDDERPPSFRRVEQKIEEFRRLGESSSDRITPDHMTRHDMA